MAGGKGVRAGRAFVEVFADDSALARGLKQAQAKLRAFGATVTSIGSRLFAVGAGAAAAFVPAIKAASDFQETLSKFQTVFGDNADAVRVWGDEFAKQVGRSKGDVLGFLASTQDLLVPLGIDPQEAADLSKRIAQLTVDLASFNNMAEADVLRDLQAALTGSGEVMKKYGVIVDEAAVKQELLNRGLDKSAATNADKVLARLSIILAGTTAAQGDAIRTAGSFANQLKRVQAQVKDLAVEIGTAILPVITPMVSKAAEIVSSLTAWAEVNPALFKSLASGTIILTAFAAALTAVGVAATGAAAAMGLLTSPITLTIGAVVALSAGVIGLVSGFDTLKLALTDLPRASAIIAADFSRIWTKAFADVSRAAVEVQAFLGKVTDAQAKMLTTAITIAERLKLSQIDADLADTLRQLDGPPADLPAGENIASAATERGAGAVGHAIAEGVIDRLQHFTQAGGMAAAMGGIGTAALGTFSGDRRQFLSGTDGTQAIVQEVRDVSNAIRRLEDQVKRGLAIA